MNTAQIRSDRAVSAASVRVYDRGLEVFAYTAADKQLPAAEDTTQR